MTLNPSLDRTLMVTELTRGEVLQADAARDDPGGKGVNVARALAAHGDKPVAVLPVGGSIGRALVVQLLDQGVDVEAVTIKGATRTNITIVEPDGVTTKLNEPGPLLLAEEIDSLIDAVSRRAAAGGWVVVGGSLPPGVEPGIVSMVIAAAHEAGALVAIDTRSDALAAGLAAEPELAKPNVRELLEVAGGSAATLGDVVGSCQTLMNMGAKSVLCSMGPDGALLVKDGGVWHASAPPAEVRNPVGAGDALLAGYLFTYAAPPASALRAAVAWAAAALRTAGTGVPLPELIDIASVRVTDAPDLARTLVKY